MSGVRQLAKGQRFFDPITLFDIEVTRVAKDLAWADIIVTPREPWKRPWRKRQPLIRGFFAFHAEEIR